MQDGLPDPPSRLVLRLFVAYSARRMRRDFHQLRFSRGSRELAPGAAHTLIVYANHASWWDPLVALVIRSMLFPDREAFVPIDAPMLERYGIFKKLGFFGVDRHSAAGTRRFLRVSSEILHRPGAMLFITPQGRFADPRERPLVMERGLAYLAHRHPGALCLPFALEYPFWHESKPEILTHFGTPVEVHPDQPVDDLHDSLANALTATQDQLAAMALRRDPDEFETLLSGASGVGGFYDAWRTTAALLRGKRPQLRHGEL